MIVRIRRVFGETLENLKNEKMMFFSTLITMMVILFILNIFIAYTLNIRIINNFIKTNLQVKIYLENSITDDGLKDLQKKIMKYSEIKSIKYISKDMALKQMGINLQMDFEFSENPLPDVFILSIEEGINLVSLVEKLKKEPGVSEVEEKTVFIDNLNKIVKSLEYMTIYIYVIIAIPVFIMIFNLISQSISRRKEDIEVKSLVGAGVWYIKMPFILEGIIHVVLSSGLSLAVFVPLYDYFTINVSDLLPFITFVPMKEVATMIFIVVISFGFVVTLLASSIAIRVNLRMYGD